MMKTNLKSKTSIGRRPDPQFNVAYWLLILLLFWVPIESTPLGRAYNYIVGLNSASLALDMSAVYIQWILLFTIVVPFLIAIFSQPALPNPGPMKLIRAGLVLWVSGSAISTIARINDPTVVLDSAAGIISAGAVFFAVRRVRMTTTQHYEIACAAIATGGLITSVVDLYRYHAAWGIPNLQKIILIKYLPDFWSDHCFFGNPDNASCAYGLFAMLGIGVLFSGLFSRTTRFLMLATIASCSLEIVLTMARTGIVFLAFALIASAIFARKWNIFVAMAMLSAALALSTSGGVDAMVINYFRPAISYDTKDNNTQSRIQSMQQGWHAFENNFVTGVGAGRTRGVVDEDVPHELAIWQATEDGVLGLLGVLLVMAGSFYRFISILWSGATSYALQIEFALLLAPAMYFLRGFVSNAAVSNSVFNTWICLAFALLAMADRMPPVQDSFVMNRVLARERAESDGKLVGSSCSR